MNTVCAVSLLNHLRAVADTFFQGLISATEQMRGELHKSEVLVIASTLLVVKVEQIYPEACNFIKKETLVLMFSCEFCEIFKNTFFLQNTSSGCFYMVQSVKCFREEHSNAYTLCLHFLIVLQFSINLSKNESQQRSISHYEKP